MLQQRRPAEDNRGLPPVTRELFTNKNPGSGDVQKNRACQVRMLRAASTKQSQNRHEHVEQIKIDLDGRDHVIVGTVLIA